MRTSSCSDSSPTASADRMMQHREEQQAVEDLVPHRLAEGVAGDGPDASHGAGLAPLVPSAPAWACRMKKSSSDSRRGETETTCAAPVEGDLEERPQLLLLAQLDRRALRRLAGGGAFGQRGQPREPGPQHHLGRQQPRRQQLVQRPHAAGPPREHHRHPVAGHLHIGEDVGRVKDRAPLLLELEDQIADLLAPQRIQPGHRLVEHHQLGIAHERLSDAHPLQHALGELAQRPPARVAQAHPLHQPRCPGPPLGPADVRQSAHQIQELLGREVIVEIRRFG